VWPSGEFRKFRVLSRAPDVGRRFLSNCTCTLTLHVQLHIAIDAIARWSDKIRSHQIKPSIPGQVAWPAALPGPLGNGRERRRRALQPRDPEARHARETALHPANQHASHGRGHSLTLSAEEAVTSSFTPKPDIPAAPPPRQARQQLCDRGPHRGVWGASPHPIQEAGKRAEGPRTGVP